MDQATVGKLDEVRKWVKQNDSRSSKDPTLTNRSIHQFVFEFQRYMEKRLGRTVSNPHFPPLPAPSALFCSAVRSSLLYLPVLTRRAERQGVSLHDQTASPSLRGLFVWRRSCHSYADLPQEESCSFLAPSDRSPLFDLCSRLTDRLNQDSKYKKFDWSDPLRTAFHDEILAAVEKALLVRLLSLFAAAAAAACVGRGCGTHSGAGFWTSATSSHLLQSLCERDGRRSAQADC